VAPAESDEHRQVGKISSEPEVKICFHLSASSV
jgi:hypothetical protein